MQLSSRAAAYLESLERVESVPTAKVTERLKLEGIPSFSSWTEFHDKFAGYVENIGVERAIWGLMHFASEWQDPLDVSVDRDGGEYLIGCADVHPSYDYWLRNNGEFSGIGGGGPCESFDKKVEQTALLWSATRVGDWSLIVDFNDWSPERQQPILAGRDRGFIPEASDKYKKCWLTDRHLVFQVRAGCTVWTRE